MVEAPHLHEETGMEDRYGTWSVTWRTDDFHLPAIGSFSFQKIMLPIEIVPSNVNQAGLLIVKVEPSFRFTILPGAPLKELERFKKRASSLILAAAGTSRLCCSDCAIDAGTTASAWNGSVCVGCREHFCKNLKCLRRLKKAGVEKGIRGCTHCAAGNDPDR